MYNQKPSIPGRHPFTQTVLNHKESLVKSFDQVFDQIVAASFPGFTDQFGVDFFSKASYPKCNIVDYDDKITIVAEIAGLSKDDIEIDFEHNTVTITGGKRYEEENEESTGKIIHRELKHSSFKRAFMLSEKFDVTDISAEFDNGLLSIHIPKKEHEVNNSTRIEIK